MDDAVLLPVLQAAGAAWSLWQLWRAQHGWTIVDGYGRWPARQRA